MANILPAVSLDPDELKIVNVSGLWVSRGLVGVGGVCDVSGF